MKAVVLERAGKISIKEIPRPVPASGEVLIRVKACGICGSDIRYFYGENPWSLQTLGLSKPNPASIVLGHEFSGEIEGVGDEISPSRKGERVGVLAYKACEECHYCKSGLHNLCANVRHLGHGAGWPKRKYYPGGMTEYCSVWSDKTYLLPKNITFEEATFLDGIAVAVHAVNRSRIIPGDDIVILGAGPISLLILQVAKAFGVGKVFCVDVYNKPLEVAEEIGVDGIINAKRQNVVSRIMRATKSCGVNAVFDTVGTKETFAQGIKMLRRGGTLILLAVSQIRVPINLLDISSERTITSSANNLYPDYKTAISLLSAGRISVKHIITHRFSLSEIHEAIKVATNKEIYNALKVILFP